MKYPLLFATAVAFFSIAATAAELPKDVVVRQGGADLTFSEIDARISEIPERDRAGYMDSPERIETMLRQQLLLEILAAEGKKNGVDKSPEFAGRLDLATKRVYSQLRIQQVAEQAPKADGEALVREAYLSNPARFKRPDGVDVSHILLTTKERVDADAKAQIEAIEAEIKSGKISFADAATRSSEDKGTAQRGGVLPTVRRGQTAKEFEAAAFGLKNPGDMAIAKSQFGYHLIRLTAHRAGEQLTEAEAIKEFAPRFVEEARARYMQDYLAKLRSEALEADPDRVASLRTRYAKEAAAGAVPPASTTSVTDSPED